MTTEVDDYEVTYEPKHDLVQEVADIFRAHLDYEGTCAHEEAARVVVAHVQQWYIKRPFYA